MIDSVAASRQALPLAGTVGMFPIVGRLEAPAPAQAPTASAIATSSVAPVPARTPADFLCSGMGVLLVCSRTMHRQALRAVRATGACGSQTSRAFAPPRRAE